MGRPLGSCGVLLAFLSILIGCEYVRPTLNAPLKQWERAGGYRFSNVAPGGEDNSDSLLILATFSGGGTRASALAFGALRELARQQITWEGKPSGSSTSSMPSLPCPAARSRLATMP